MDAFIAFAAQTSAARLPLKAAWHPGDAAWLIKDNAGPPPVKLLRRDGVAAAAISFVSDGEVWIEGLSDADFMAGVAWAEAKAGGALAVRALERDGARIALLEAAGFQRDELEGLCFERALGSDLPLAAPPAGFRFRDCVDIDPDARARCHRDAWSHLAHLGIHGAGSQFSTEIYQRLCAGPCYEPALDLLLEAPDGTLVANCIAWIDPGSRVGEFEPFGTHVEFRGRGLARVLAHEGMRRMKARGMTLARVSTAYFNSAAARAYAGAGFTQVDRWRWWRKL